MYTFFIILNFLRFGSFFYQELDFLQIQTPKEVILYNF